MEARLLSWHPSLGPLLLVATCAAAAAQSPPCDVSRLRDSVVELSVESGHASRHAVGFFVDIGRAVAHRDALEGATTAWASHAGRRHRVTAVLADDPETGLVLLAIDLPDGAPPPLELARETPDPGEAVTLLAGCGEDGNAPCPRGEVASRLDLPGFGTVFTTTIQAAAARPGAALVNDAGEVVGVQAAGGDSTRLFYIPAVRLRALPVVAPCSVREWAWSTAGGEGRVTRAGNEGERLALEGRYDAALEVFRRRTRENPSDASAWEGVALCLRELGRVSEAADAYHRLTVLTPGDARAWFQLGVAASDAGRWDEAAAAFGEAAALAPLDPSVHYNLGVACGNLGEIEREAAAYTAAVRLDPEHAAAYHNLGMAYMRLERYHDARQVLARAVRLAPDDVDGHAALGLACMKLEDHASAVASLQRAAELRQESAAIRLALGRALLAAGDVEGARREEEALRAFDAGAARQLAAEIAELVK